MITVLTVNYNSDDFINLMVKTAGMNVPFIVVDNSDIPTLKSRPLMRVHANPGEKTHGEGLNFGIRLVENPYVLILDADCHFLCPGWRDIVQEMEAGEYDVLTVAGPPQKPMRPACVFMRTDYAKTLDWRATPGYRGHRITPEGFDVGILAYRRMINDGLKVKFMDIMPNRYGTLNGEEYGNAEHQLPLIYHHWHGTHLSKRAYDYPGKDLEADKAKLFECFKYQLRPVKKFL